MIDQLCPGLDRALSALLLDLEQRGLLDETLVVLLSEHGRTPRLKDGNGGGRDHWSRAYSALFAGGGIARGNVVGGTDAIAGDVVDRPISPKSLLATMYHLLGIDPRSMVPDSAGRPTPLVPEEAEVVPEMLA
jgi:arylsulfatase A-like enzyme